MRLAARLPVLRRPVSRFLALGVRNERVRTTAVPTAAVPTAVVPTAAVPTP